MVTERKSPMAGKSLRDILRASQDEMLAKRDTDPEEFARYIASQEAADRREADDEARRVAAREAARAAEVAARPLRALAEKGIRLPDDVVDLMLGGQLGNSPAMQAVAKWKAEARTPWLIIGGVNGCGKTVAMADHVRRVDGARWVRSDDIIRLFAGFFGDAREQQLALRDAALVGIDELGTETDPQRLLPALLELLDARCSVRATPTICTTNLKRSDFAAHYGNNGRLNSRLNELATFVTCEGTDLRKRKK